MSDFDTDPFFRGPKVQAHLDDLRSTDMQLVKPLQYPITGSNETIQEVIQSSTNLADRLRLDLDLLQADLTWIGSLPTSYPSAGVDVSMQLQLIQLTDLERQAAAAWIANANGLAALGSLLAKTRFDQDRQLVDNYVASLSDALSGQYGQALELTGNRLRCALLILEGGVLTSQTNMIESGVHAYEFYESSGLTL